MDNKKIAVVTGGSRGIGKEIAAKLAEEAYVIVNYNGSEEKAAQVVREIKDKGGNAEAVKCNVASFKECEKFIGDIVERFGKIDILVNNAGINKDGLILSMSEEDFDSVINTNLKGTFNCIKFVSKSMIKNRYGKIINISSISGVVKPAFNSIPLVPIKDFVKLKVFSDLKPSAPIIASVAGLILPPIV